MGSGDRFSPRFLRGHPRQGVFGGDDGGLDGRCWPAALPGHNGATGTQYPGGRAESQGRVFVRVSDQEILAQPWGQQSRARRGQLGKECLAWQSCSAFCWAAGSWVAPGAVLLYVGS